MNILFVLCMLNLISVFISIYSLYNLGYNAWFGEMGTKMDSNLPVNQKILIENKCFLARLLALCTFEVK